MKLTASDIYAMTYEETAADRADGLEDDTHAPWWMWASAMTIAAAVALVVAIPTAYALHLGLMYFVK